MFPSVLIVGLAIYYGEIGQIDFTSRAFEANCLAASGWLDLENHPIELRW